MMPVILTFYHYLNLEMRVVCRKFLAFRNVFIVFFESNQMTIYFCTRNLEHSRLKPGFRYTISTCICVGR